VYRTPPHHYLNTNNTPEPQNSWFFKLADPQPQAVQTNTTMVERGRERAKEPARGVTDMVDNSQECNNTE
jgi:hypothetical protein